MSVRAIIVVMKFEVAIEMAEVLQQVLLNQPYIRDVLEQRSP